MKILIVDDEENIRSLIHAFVSGNDVLTAADGLEGLAAAREHRPDVIISDTFMPNLNGPDMAEQYGAENPAAKVMLMSGAIENAEKLYPGIREKYVVLQKPFTYSEFLQAFGAVCKETS